MSSLRNTSNPSEPRYTAFRISSRELDDHTSVISVEGELDLASAPNLKWTMVDLLRAGRGQLVLDLSQVNFMDSTALGVLIGLDRNLSAGERIAIACLRPSVAKIFELTGLDGALQTFATVRDALEYARGRVAPAG
jgi:anti-sigma B factor antagonist